MFSQNDEEKIILNFLGDFQGRFLDIGAYDGVNLSNTRALALRGWSGVYVEPDPRNLCKLIENSKGLDITIVATAANICNSINQLRMDESPQREWASTVCLSNPHVLQQSPITYFIPATDINTLVTPHYDFISIDAEHMDFRLLKAIRQPLKCKLLCIEPSGLDERVLMKEYLISKRFSILYETHENILASKE